MIHRLCVGLAIWKQLVGHDMRHWRNGVETQRANKLRSCTASDRRKPIGPTPSRGVARDVENRTRLPARLIGPKVFVRLPPLFLF